MGAWNSLRIETSRDVFEWQALQHADKLAVVSPQANKKYTFHELNQRANRLANALIDVGVKKGDRIAILATDGHEFIEILGTTKAGIVLVTLNWRLTGPELAYIINDSGACTVFVEEQFSNTIRSIRAEVPNVKNFICTDASPQDMLNYQELVSKYPPDDPGIDVFEDDLLELLYTSGTTGVPKGVMRKHKDVLRFARQVVRLVGFRSDDRCFSTFPLYHAALIHFNFAFVMVGATQWILPRFDPKEVLELIQKERINFMAAAPTMVIFLTEYPERSKYDVSSLRLVCYIGSPMPEAAIKNAMDAFGPIFLQMYGLSEGTGQTALTREDHVMALKEPGKEGILNSAGHPDPSVQLRIVDDNDNDVPLGEVGEIALRSDCITDGYWNKPEETKQTWRNGWLHTGDVAKVDENGYVYIVDRKKDIIVSGGENVASKEVENTIYTHPAILEAAVIGVPSEKWGEAVKAVVALKPGMTATPEEIMDYCASRMAGFKKPKSVEIWPELPKNPVGKILKREIREKYWAGHERKVQ